MDDTSTSNSAAAGPPRPVLSRGTIIGSAVGGGVAFIILLILFYLIVRDRNYRNRGQVLDLPVEAQDGGESSRPALENDGVQAPKLHKTQAQDRTKLSSRESTAVGSGDSSPRTLSLPKKTHG
ncbi:Pyruvate decarboxylase [Venturia nashicola]|uniref:Pyruvate decarboxylase n=1 Tax=Venturia nashicola TaxID=86259 RepID=A0A4Z1PPI5_9PEZI|nr:Pyruvate decarboxylase [Venturia nashicola]TLD36843.1 Pyruvate decarboxylase [Venturia nashicola]